MTTHLTDRQLIDHQFKLGTEAEEAPVTAHLESCADCRARRDVLMQSLSALDLLKDADTPSDIVQATLAHVHRAVEAGDPEAMAAIVRIPRMITIGTMAAAAVVVLAVALWWPMLHGKPDPTGLAPVVKKIEQESTQPSSISFAHAAAGSADEFAKKPFAPANNIELNVLPRRDNVELTIYNDADLTLVREQRSLTLQRGWNWLQYMWANTLIDPTSLMLEPTTNRSEVEVQELVFPPRLREVGRWLIASKVSGSVPFELRNFTAGIKWEAVYNATLAPDEKTMRLNGFVRVTNKSGEDYENAQVRLVVGKINMKEAVSMLARTGFGKPSGYECKNYEGVTTNFCPSTAGVPDKGYLLFFSTARAGTGCWSTGGGLPYRNAYIPAPKKIAKDGLSEYVLYTIEGREDLENGWAKRLQSFDVADIAITNMYKYDEERWGKQVMRFISTKNDTSHQLGQTPIPNGRVVVSRMLADDQHLGYIGQTKVKYIPVNDEIEFDLGAVGDITIEPALMAFSTSDYEFDTAGDVCRWKETRRWDIKIANTRDLPVNIEITRGFLPTEWSIGFTNGAPMVKHDVTHVRFTLTVPAGTKTNIGYEVTMKMDNELSKVYYAPGTSSQWMIGTPARPY